MTKEHRFVDWHQFSLDQLADYLEEKYLTSSSGEALAIHKLVKFYRDNKDKPKTEPSKTCDKCKTQKRNPKQLIRPNDYYESEAESLEINPETGETWRETYLRDAQKSESKEESGIIQEILSECPKSRTNEPNTKEDNFYQKSLKSVSIKTRLNGLFQWEWLIMNVPEARQPTGGELSEAMEWAHKLSDQAIKDFKTCEENLKPNGIKR